MSPFCQPKKTWIYAILTLLCIKMISATKEPQPLKKGEAEEEKSWPQKETMASEADDDLMEIQASHYSFFTVDRPSKRQLRPRGQQDLSQVSYVCTAKYFKAFLAHGTKYASQNR